MGGDNWVARKKLQVCVGPWTVLRQADLRMYLFWGGRGMILSFYVKKIVPVDMA
jgi:hypothetical protein